MFFLIDAENQTYAAAVDPLQKLDDIWGLPHP
jgi:hypothetical protein